MILLLRTEKQDQRDKRSVAAVKDRQEVKETKEERVLLLLRRERGRVEETKDR